MNRLATSLKIIAPLGTNGGIGGVIDARRFTKSATDGRSVGSLESALRSSEMTSGETSWPGGGSNSSLRCLKYSTRSSNTSPHGGCPISIRHTITAAA